MRRLVLALALLVSCAFAQSPPLLKIEAQYSEEARIAGLEGSVVVTGTIAADGSLPDLKVDRPLGLGLDEQAIAAAAQVRLRQAASSRNSWRFRSTSHFRPSSLTGT